MASERPRPRPRPFTKNMTQLEEKFEGLVTTALGSKPFNQSFENVMASTVCMAQHVGIMILTQKRLKAAAAATAVMPRLPSEVWHLMLMEFGGICADQHIPIMFLPLSPPILGAPVIWDLYTTHMALYHVRVADAKECRNCMKRFMRFL